MKPFKLTKEEFIKRSMAGEKFIGKVGDIFHYDGTHISPFRINQTVIGNSWNDFNNDSDALFTLVQPEPVIERRYKWFKNEEDGETHETSFMSDDCAIRNNCLVNGWCKDENLFRDVEIKQ